MKLIFLGTPDFAKICLEHISKSNHEIIAVICSHDKPVGRGNKLQMPPAKVWALNNNVPVYQFKSIRKEGVDLIKQLNPDIMVTGAFGQIISQQIIDIPKHGIVNIHGSLLPKYRGASPVQTAILNGETVTGVTIMKTEAGIDTGDMLLKQQINIMPEDNTQTLMEKLAHIGGELCVNALDLIQSGKDKTLWEKQDETKATFTKMLKKENCQIDFDKTALEIVNFVRAYNPNPVANFVYGNNVFKVYQASVYQNQIQGEFENGQIVIANSKKGLVIKCSNGYVEITSFQAPNGKIMQPKAYLNGKPMTVGTFLNQGEDFEG